MTKPQLVGLDGQELRKAELVVPRGIDSTTDISNYLEFSGESLDARVTGREQLDSEKFSFFGFYPKGFQEFAKELVEKAYAQAEQNGLPYFEVVTFADVTRPKFRLPKIGGDSPRKERESLLDGALESKTDYSRKIERKYSSYLNINPNPIKLRGSFLPPIIPPIRKEEKESFFPLTTVFGFAQFYRDA